MEIYGQKYIAPRRLCQSAGKAKWWGGAYCVKTCCHNGLYPEGAGPSAQDMAGNTFPDLCQCEFCQYYARHIKAAYPQIAKYLAVYGIDIEKPFETMYDEEFANGFIYYWSVQYVVIGDETASCGNCAGKIFCCVSRSGNSGFYKGKI